MPIAPRSFNASNISLAPPDYRPSLIRLLSVMGFTETAVAKGLLEFKGKFTHEVNEHVEETIGDEYSHGRIAFDMLAQLGVSRGEAEKIVFDTV